MSASHAVSAPGKVLVAGGYLVLDRAYTGLVFGLSARIHVVITSGSVKDGSPLISVRSPQFDEPSWDYIHQQAAEDGGIEITQSTGTADRPTSRNPFVETTLRYVLSYISKLTNASFGSASLIILADNDYYTTPAELPNGERFHNFRIPLSKVHKTGLGSSAALVTALTAALLQHYLPEFDLKSNGAKQRLHNLAQAAHCAAQGKVGSGFDVASAVFGSCIYRRFSPQILSSLPEPGTDAFATRLVQAVNETDVRWDTEILKNEVVVPKGLRMVMCDVSCGSQTPGMVKKVLAWRVSQPEAANTIWKDLDGANLHLAAELREVAKTSDYTRLTASFDAIRRQIRKMGEGSDVPIEPPAQTRLIDACCKIDGVIGGTVPGAGGYDAIVLLIEDKEQVVSDLQRLFTAWQFGDESGEGKVSMLGVREEMEGVRSEGVSAYSSWI
ncbi:hypothetical protein AMS68_004363 [Peltaster fructicola]|uniref:Phosphomevalonate kinase n=1 Tax=Peltaster fructicola TaxID=286661 RepID=A0A6H0XVY6_9PEZI|nr:hypothetical protein AMS68_004363 [Peltaster fructicola]